MGGFRGFVLTSTVLHSIVYAGREIHVKDNDVDEVVVSNVVI